MPTRRSHLIVDDAGSVLQQALVEQVLQPRRRQVVWRIDEGTTKYNAQGSRSLVAWSRQTCRNCIVCMRHDSKCRLTLPDPWQPANEHFDV
jgi:hypothetical protein